MPPSGYAESGQVKVTEHENPKEIKIFPSKGRLLEYLNQTVQEATELI